MSTYEHAAIDKKYNYINVLAKTTVIWSPMNVVIWALSVHFHKKKQVFSSKENPSFVQLNEITDYFISVRIFFLRGTPVALCFTGFSQTIYTGGIS
jgi:hypothetical protein